MGSFYLAARYSRREELQGYRAALEQRGHTVYGQWLSGDHHLAGEDDILHRPDVGSTFALHDLSDIHEADTMVAFTEAPRSAPNRGGRHVELGYALALPFKRVVVVGPRENVFHCLPQVTVYATWAEFLQEVSHGE